MTSLEHGMLLLTSSSENHSTNQSEQQPNGPGYGWHHQHFYYDTVWILLMCVLQLFDSFCLGCIPKDHRAFSSHFWRLVQSCTVTSVSKQSYCACLPAVGTLTENKQAKNKKQMTSVLKSGSTTAARPNCYITGTHFRVLRICVSALLIYPYRRLSQRGTQDEVGQAKIFSKIRNQPKTSKTHPVPTEFQ